MAFRRMAFLLSVSVLDIFVPACFAADGPHCGLHCIHAALHSLDLRSDLNELVISQNLSGSFGSTAEDLIRIAEQQGATGTYRSKMTLADLRSATTPVILHTSVAVSKTGFHHWILFLGMDGDNARIYDPPRSTYAIPVAEVMSFWDCRGIIVRGPHSQPAEISWNFELMLAFFTVFAAYGIVVQFSRLRRFPVVSLLIVAGVSAIAWHTFTDFGFIYNQGGTTIVAGRFTQFDAPALDIDRLKSMLNQNNVTIIDARQPEAYQRSHVPGAINLPITVTHGDLRNTLASVPKGNEVVVYCQSDECLWSDQIAEQLAVRGYQASILRDGMNGWTAAGNADHDLVRGN